MSPSHDFFVCSHCGAEVPVSKSICKQCGSEDSTGWSDKANPFASEPPEFNDPSDFDYQKAVEAEFGGGSDNRKTAFPTWVGLTGFVLVFLFLYVLVRF